MPKPTRERPATRHGGALIIVAAALVAVAGLAAVLRTVGAHLHPAANREVRPWVSHIRPLGTSGLAAVRFAVDRAIVIDLTDGTQVPFLEWHDATAIAASPRGDDVLVCRRDGLCELHSVDGLEFASGRFVETGLSYPRDCTFSRSGSRFAVAGRCGNVVVVDTETRAIRYRTRPLEPLAEPSTEWSAAAFGPSDDILYLARRGSLVEVDLANGTETPVGDCDPTTSVVSMSPDGRYIVVGSQFDSRLWDVASGRLIRVEPCASPRLAWSTTGDQLLVCDGVCGHLSIRDPASGRITADFPDSMAREVVVHPNGRIFCGFRNGSVCRWQPDGNELTPLWNTPNVADR